MATPPPFDVAPLLPGLRRYARALTRDPSEADDLVQDALLRACERAGSFEVGRSLRAWLFAILHNRFIDRRRARAAEQRRDEGYALICAPAVAVGEAEQAVEIREVAARFAALPEPQRGALHLVAVEGLSYQEAAAALGVPIGTIMSRLARARATLRAEPVAGEPRLRMVGGTDAP